MPVLGSAVVLHGGGRRAANVQGRLEVSFVCELQAGDASLPYAATKRNWGGSERLEGCTELLQLPSSLRWSFRWRHAEGNERRKKGNF